MNLSLSSNRAWWWLLLGIATGCGASKVPPKYITLYRTEIFKILSKGNLWWLSGTERIFISKATQNCWKKEKFIPDCNGVESSPVQSLDDFLVLLLRLFNGWFPGMQLFITFKMCCLEIKKIKEQKKGLLMNAACKGGPFIWIVEDSQEWRIHCVLYGC